MNERLKERIAEEWAMLDPVDPLRSLLSDVIDALKQKPLAKVEPCEVCGEGKARLLVLRSCDICHSEYAGQAEMKVALGKPEREPVAWVREHEFPLAPGDAFSWVETFVHKTPLYTTPPKRPWGKPWVSLTDEEMQALWDRYAHMEMMRAIEAKLKAVNGFLKEKNT